MSISEAASKKARGRPRARIFAGEYIKPDRTRRHQQNTEFASQTIALLQKPEHWRAEFDRLCPPPEAIMANCSQWRTRWSVLADLGRSLSTCGLDLMLESASRIGQAKPSVCSGIQMSGSLAHERNPPPGALSLSPRFGY